MFLVIFPTISALCLIWAGFMAIPYIQPPYMLIGARVTKSFNECLGKKIKRLYAIFSTALFTLSLLISFAMITYVDSLIALLTATIFTSLSQTINYVIFRSYVLRKRGEIQAKDSIRYAVLNHSKAGERYLSLLIIPWILALITFLIGLVYYNKIPSEVIFHIGPGGSVEYAPKTPLNVFLNQLISIIILAIYTMIVFGTRGVMNILNPSYPGKSFRIQQSLRKYIVESLAIMFTGIQLSMSIISFGAWEMININTSLVISLSILFMSIFGGIIYIVYKVTRLRNFERETDVEFSLINDDKYWIGGIFYYNPEDDRIFVPKRAGIGYTLNFGNKKAILLLSVIVSLPILISFLAILLS
ncbi:DUF5808 domain-containing protein [Sulfolobus acidocaldarius]|nr:DUF5808 domain-containing protein [Sulfolobus acidocaldarius]